MSFEHFLVPLIQLYNYVILCDSIVGVVRTNYSCHLEFSSPHFSTDKSSLSFGFKLKHQWLLVTSILYRSPCLITACLSTSLQSKFLPSWKIVLNSLSNYFYEDCSLFSFLNETKNQN